MKKVVVLLFFIPSIALTQNLVPNPDFEIYGAVPCGWTASAGAFAAATNSWTSPTQATPDIFSTLINPSCTNFQPHSTDPSCNGHQAPNSGNIFAGFYTQVGGSTWREYLQVQLTQPLDSGHTYKVSLYLSLSDNSQYATNNIGIGFTLNPVNSPLTNEIGYNPQVNFTSVMSDTANWVYLSDTITATAPWGNLIIGNFFNDAATNIVFFNAGGYWDRAYYYADDVSVEEIVINTSPINFAASDTSLCEKFCIGFADSSLNNPASWQWSFPGGIPSASTDQNPANICYDVPGTYNVTLITTSASGSDTLNIPDYITVYATPPFPVITQNGYTLTSSPADFYQWQLNAADIPGATNQSYIITQSGYYTVVITDLHGCVNSASLDILISGTRDISDEDFFVIYPNPSDGKFVVESASGERPAYLKILNALGQEILYLKGNLKTEVDISGVSAGIYFLEIRNSNRTVVEKILIEK